MFGTFQPTETGPLKTNEIGQVVFSVRLVGEGRHRCSGRRNLNLNQKLGLFEGFKELESLL